MYRWAFSSATSSIDVLNNDMFCGTQVALVAPPPIALQFRHNSQGERTIFRIRVLSGVDISALSSVPGGPCPSSHSAFSAHACDFAEKEILLLPCCCFDILKASPSPFIPESSCCGVTLLQVENLHAVAPGLLMIDLEEVDSPFSLSGL